MSTMHTRIDPIMMRGASILSEVFVEFGISQGASNEEAQELLETIPQEYQTSSAFLDSLQSMDVWRYDFGDPANEPMITGTHTFPTVSRLFCSIQSAKERMLNPDFEIWTKKLWNFSQHQSTLEEFSPILHLHTGIGVIPEVTGESGNIDWELLVPWLPSVLLEVKYRHVDFIEQLRRINPNSKIVPAPTHDANMMFASLIHKFQSSDPEQQLQGAWIATQIKQERNELQVAFDNLDASRIHFAFLVPPGAKNKSCYLLTRNGIQREELLRIFGFIHSENTMTFDRGNLKI